MKYLMGLVLDRRWNFVEHFRRLAPTQPRRAKRLLPEALRGNRAVHGALWGAGVGRRQYDEEVNPLVAQGSEDHGNPDDQWIPHGLR